MRIGRWGGIIPYWNTVSQPVNGAINYGTDPGYDVIRQGPYRLGIFAGYNYYKSNKSAYGCTQIADQASDCASPLPSSVLTITQDDTWQSLRLGFNSQIVIANRLELEADIAYAPYVSFSGADDHLLRSLISPESGTGQASSSKGLCRIPLLAAFHSVSAAAAGRCGRTTTPSPISAAPPPALARPNPPRRSFTAASYRDPTRSTRQRCFDNDRL
jgi:hypothetical protein